MDDGNSVSEDGQPNAKKFVVMLGHLKSLVFPTDASMKKQQYANQMPVNLERKRCEKTTLQDGRNASGKMIKKSLAPRGTDLQKPRNGLATRDD